MKRQPSKRAKEATTPEKIVSDLWQARATQALVAGVELDLFSHVAAGKETPAEIAKAARASLRGTALLLNALVGLGYLNKRGGRYGLEPVAREFLIKGSKKYLGDFVQETRLTWPNWSQLTEAVRTGRSLASVDDPSQGAEFFAKLVPAIFPMSFAAASAAVAALPARIRNGIGQILDVAAGAAPWSIAFALALPHARVTAVDLPGVTSVARQFAGRFGVGDRFDYSEGDLRDLDFGRNRYDLAILGHIIHSEGEKAGRQLIRKSYRALKRGGLLLIAEIIPNDSRTGPLIPLLFGLNMLLHTRQGDVFTMAEYKRWLKEAGFNRIRTIQSPSPSPLILATK
jgi:ubiquinone/menaquinone biosynthesis C-methylase UbiE